MIKKEHNIQIIKKFTTGDFKILIRILLSENSSYFRLNNSITIASSSTYFKLNYNSQFLFLTL